MFSAAIPLGPSACVYLNPGLLPPPRLAPPGDLVINSDATPDPHCGGWGAIQYYYHFRPDSGAIPLLTLQTATHPLPPHFKEDLLAFEHWPAVDTLLTFEDPDPTEPIPILSISCPESQTIASPDHGITFCNGPARTTRAYSHGPSLAQADWHRIISDTSGYWQGDHCHTLGVGGIAEAFHLGRLYGWQYPTISLSDCSFAPIRLGSPSPGGPAILPPRTLRICLCHLPGVSLFLWQSRRGTLLCLQRPQPRLRKGTLRHRPPNPSSVSPLLQRRQLNCPPFYTPSPSIAPYPPFVRSLPKLHRYLFIARPKP